MNTETQTATQSSKPKFPLRLRILLFFGGPFPGLELLIASIVVATAGAIAGKWMWIFLGAVFAVAATGLVAYRLVMTLDCLTEWARVISEGISLLNNGQQQTQNSNVQSAPSSPIAGSFRN